MKGQIRIAIVDDHQSIIDGYIHRLQNIPQIQIVGTGVNGEDLQRLLATQRVDVLLLDLSIPTSGENRNPYPLYHELPALLQQHPGLKIIVLSMFTQLSLVKAMFDLGVRGYIFKDDNHSIQQLGKVVAAVASGGVYFSEGADTNLLSPQTERVLTPRQLEVISLCMAYPDLTTDELAKSLNIASSTLRNLLSEAYRRLGVQTRAAAIAKAQHLGILPGKNKLDN